MVDQCNVVTDFFHGSHVVGREDDGVSLIFQFQDFPFQQFSIDRIESGERFVEDQQLGFVEHGNDKLYFLLHTFGQFFQFFVPPWGDFKLFEPFLQAGSRFAAAQSFQLGQVNGLIAYFHFLVQSPFFRQVSDVEDIFRP